MTGTFNSRQRVYGKFTCVGSFVAVSVKWKQKSHGEPPSERQRVATEYNFIRASRTGYLV